MQSACVPSTHKRSFPSRKEPSLPGAADLPATDSFPSPARSAGFEPSAFSAGNALS